MGWLTILGQVPDLRMIVFHTISRHCCLGQKLIVQDSLQAFSSSIAGLLSSRAVLQGEELITVTLGV